MGDQDSQERDDLDAIFPSVYGELRAIAARIQRRQRSGDARPTSLVHEAWMRLSRSGSPMSSEVHLASAAAMAMRSVLVDRARRSAALKRGGGWQRVTLRGIGSGQEMVDILALDDALQQLAVLHPRAAEVVQLRFFGGLENREIAGLLDLTTRTVERDWRMARAWLVAHLEG